MKRLLLVLLLVSTSAYAQPYTEVYTVDLPVFGTPASASDAIQTVDAGQSAGSRFSQLKFTGDTGVCLQGDGTWDSALLNATLAGKTSYVGTVVNDDDCAGEQGYAWYDSTDNAFEWCNANSGAPIALGGISVEDEAWGATWEADTTNAASKHALYHVLAVVDTNANGSLADETPEYQAVSTIPATHPEAAFKDSDAPGADKDMGAIGIEYVDGVDGAENADVIIYAWQGGVKTEILRFDESDDQWETTKGISAPSINSSNAAATAVKTGDYAIGSSNAQECYGGTIFVAGTATITACDNLASGMSFSVETNGAYAVSLDPQSDDKMYLDGVLLDDGDQADNTSTTLDKIECKYYSADGWWCVSNGWADGGHTNPASELYAAATAIWDFDNNANDTVGTYNLTPYNTPTYGSTTPHQGTHYATLAAASSQYFAREVDDAGLDPASGSYSIAFWFRPHSFSTYYGIMGKYGSGAGYLASISTGKPWFRNYLAYNTGNILVNAVPTDNTWYHVVISYDSAGHCHTWMSASTFGDASNDYSAAVAQPAGDTAAAFRIGNNSASSLIYFDGDIDEVVFWKNKVLSAAEAESVFNGTWR